jgi:hypothetical protein
VSAAREAPSCPGLAGIWGFGMSHFLVRISTTIANELGGVNLYLSAGLSSRVVVTEVPCVACLNSWVSQNVNSWSETDTTVG